jgi:hypothetical protein
MAKRVKTYRLLINMCSISKNGHVGWLRRRFKINDETELLFKYV